MNRKLVGQVRDEQCGIRRTVYDTPRMPLERVLERPDEEVPAVVKARIRAEAAQLDRLALQGRTVPALPSRTHPTVPCWRRPAAVPSSVRALCGGTRRMPTHSSCNTTLVHSSEPYRPISVQFFMMCHRPHARNQTPRSTLPRSVWMLFNTGSLYPSHSLPLPTRTYVTASLARDSSQSSQFLL